MPVPPKEAIPPILDNLREPIVAAVLGAWDDWIASPYLGVWRCKRSRANFVWEQIIDRAACGHPGARLGRIADSG